jgi:hypothetical protein
MPAYGFRSQIILIATVVALAVPSLSASQAKAVPAEKAQVVPAPAYVEQDQDVKETREKLEEILKKLPPNVGRVLRTDPSLLGNESYLATYPALGVFLKQHPEIRTSPSFFFEHVGGIEFWNPQPESQGFRIWRETMQFLGVGSLLLGVTLVLTWIIRTLVEYRRWIRTSKVHTEVHNKLLDRFTANEDLLAYMQTDAGRRFLESAPLATEGPSRPVGAPFGRILWSVQVGVVLAAGGLGLLFVSGRLVLDEVAQPLFAVGVLALALGAGFVVSAGASFLLSRRLGLLDPPAALREHDEPVSR